MAAISLRGVSSSPREDGFTLQGVDLEVADGAVCCLIGPSGSGKSTLLRLVAGLEPVAAGAVWFGADEVTARPPETRDVAWFPQERPLYPHLDVEGNLGFALRTRGEPGAERTRRVQAEARAAGVARLLRRLPHTLSAGQRQAAGIARATVRLPGAFLLDEPLARIDPPERARLRSELKRVLDAVAVPVLVATNDQTEALALGDDLAVLRTGYLVQHDDARTVHDRPATAFVAAFVGSPGMNLLPGTGEVGRRGAYVRLGGTAVALAHLPPDVRARLDGAPVLLGVRPEHLRLGGADAPLAATVERVEHLGATRLVHVRAADLAEPITVRSRDPGRLRRGEPVRLRPRPDRLHLFDPVTDLALWHAAPAG